MATYATKLRQLYPYKSPTTTIDHLVIGGGVVGLSVAAGLVNTCGKDKTTFLVERRGQVCLNWLKVEAGADHSLGRRLREYTLLLEAWPIEGLIR